MLRIRDIIQKREKYVNNKASMENDMSVVDNLSSVLNTEIGIEYCGGDEDFYVEMLQDYVDGDKTDELNKFFTAKQWADYRVQIHAVKSTSLMIGAEALSEKAKALEMAAAQGDESTVTANHEAVLAEYKALMDTIRSEIE